MSEGNAVWLEFNFELSTCSEETDFEVREETYLAKYHRHSIRANPGKAHSDAWQNPDSYVQKQASGFQVFCNSSQSK